MSIATEVQGGIVFPIFLLMLYHRMLTSSRMPHTHCSWHTYYAWKNKPLMLYLQNGGIHAHTATCTPFAGILIYIEWGTCTCRLWPPLQVSLTVCHSRPVSGSLLSFMHYQSLTNFTSAGKIGFLLSEIEPLCLQENLLDSCVQT